MHYTLHQLQIFEKVAQHSSITKAAEVLHLTQPAVSLQLKKLQEQFANPLTEIVGRQLHLTSFGEEIRVAAQKILDANEQLKFTAKSFDGQLVGGLKLSVASTGKYVLPFFISEFLEEHKRIDFEMGVANKQRVLKSLKNNETDFALISVLPNDIKLRCWPLLPNKLYLIGGKKYRYARHGQDILGKVPLIFREAGSATRGAMESYLVKQGIQPSKRLTLTSNEAVKQAVMAGLGLSIMPAIGLKNELLNDQLFIIPAHGLPEVSTWNLVHMPSKQLSPVGEALVTYMEERAELLVARHFSWYENIDGLRKSIP